MEQKERMLARVIKEKIRNVKACLLIVFCTLDLVARGVTTVTTVDELLEAAAAVPSSGGTIIMASPDGKYPVTYMMTNSVLVTGLGDYNAFTLRGATGNRDDVILDFSQVSGYGVRLVGHYHGTATAHSFTVQNATNMSASTTIGGGLMVDEGFVSNVVVRNCYAGTSDLKGNPHGGGINMSGSRGICNCVVSNCAAVAGYYEAGGGGIWTRNAGTMYGTLVTNCSIKGGTYAYGGGFGSTASGYTFKNSQIIDCHSTGGTTKAGGGGVYVYGASSINNCLFVSNTIAKGPGGAFMLGYTESRNTVRDSTFIGNSCYGSNADGKGGGAISIQYANVQNCLFLGNSCSTTEGLEGGAVSIANGGSLSHCVFRGNSGAWGGAAHGTFTLVTNCVFESNVCNCATSSDATGTGALYIGAQRWSSLSAHLLSNGRVEDCIFRGNTNLLCTCDATAGNAITINPGNNAQTNMSIRNCYFDLNRGGTGTIRVNTFNASDFSPTFENRYGLNIESCTFAGNKPFSGYQIVRAGGSTFVRNCHFRDSTGYAATSYSGDGVSKAQYCVADTDMTGLSTAAEYHNYYGKRTRNKGQTQAWMSSAQDLGDGTYTIGKSADWGVTVTINNRRKRVAGRAVDVGCFEEPLSGVAVIIP